MVAQNGQKEPEKFSKAPSRSPNIMKELPKNMPIQSQLHMIYRMDPASPNSPKIFGRNFVDWAQILESQKDGTLSEYVSQNNHNATVAPMSSSSSSMVTPQLIKRPPRFPNVMNLQDSPTFEQIHQLYETDMEKYEMSIHPDEGKIFVGGLSWDTTDQSLRSYFRQFGELIECQIMRDKNTGATRGFGFVTFLNPKDSKKVFAKQVHFLDKKKIDPQPAIKEISPARSSRNIKRKVFVGGLSRSATLDDLKNYFSHFGNVEDAVLKYDYAKHRHRGFGFVTFQNEEDAQAVVERKHHIICGKKTECKEAQLKAELDKGVTSPQTVLNMLNAYNLTTDEFSQLAQRFASMKACPSDFPPNYSRFPPPSIPRTHNDVMRTLVRPPCLQPPPSQPISIQNTFPNFFQTETPPNLLLQLPYMRQE